MKKKIDYYSDNIIWAEYYVNEKDQKHGSYKRYWSDGTMWFTDRKKNGNLHGVQIIFKYSTGDCIETNI